MNGRVIEFIALFLGVPLVLAFLLPPSAMYAVLMISTAVGILLMHITPGFAWRELIKGRVYWGQVLVLGVLTLIVASLLCIWVLPDRLFFIPRQAPQILIGIILFYPPILALPQEILFRPLFYKRYGHLFASERMAVWVNAAVFSFAHLMYWHWIVFLMTFVGSFLFSHAYRQQQSFPHAVALHAIAGIAIFTSGLGWLFYSGGNVSN